MNKDKNIKSVSNRSNISNDKNNKNEKIIDFLNNGNENEIKQFISNNKLNFQLFCEIDGKKKQINMLKMINDALILDMRYKEALLCSTFIKDEKKIELILSRQNSNKCEDSLCLSVKMKNKNIIEKIISCGADINQRNIIGTVLHIVCHYFDDEEEAIEYCKYLISKGVNVNGYSKKRQTALQYSYELKKYKIVDFFINNDKIDLNYKDSNKETILHLATKSNDINTIKKLISIGIDLNDKQRDDCTALHLACYKKCDKIVNLILESDDIKIDELDKSGNSPLHIACSFNCHEIANKLIKKGANVNKMTKYYYRTPLIMAIFAKDLEMVKLLVENGANINLVIKTTNHYTGDICPIFAAIDRNCESIVSYLASKGVNLDVNKRSNNLLHKVSKKSFKYSINNEKEQKELNGIIKCLLKYKININERTNDNKTALHYSCIEGNVCTVELLISNGAEIDSVDDNNYTPLRYSIKGGNNEVTKLLIKKGAKININDLNKISLVDVDLLKDVIKTLDDKNPLIDDKTSLLTSVCRIGNIDTLKYILSFGIKPKLKSKFIQIACENQNLEFVKLILDKFNDFDLKESIITSFKKKKFDIAKLLLNFNENKKYDIPKCVLISCSDGNLEMIKLLVKKGTNLEKIDDIVYFASISKNKNILEYILNNYSCKINNDIKNPLNVACRVNSNDIIELLLSKGADVNKVDEYEATCLFHACKNDNYDVAKKLIELGADVNKLVNSKPILFCACEHSSIKIVDLLIKNKAQINKFIKIGETAIKVACFHGRDDVVKYLLENGANLSISNDILCFAVRKLKYDTIKLLIEKGVKINGGKYLASSGLTFAITSNKINVLNLLIQSGVNINALSMYGKDNALHLAADNSDEAFELLFKCGVDVNFENYSNITPFQIVCKKQNIKLLKLILPKVKIEYINGKNNKFNPICFATQQKNIPMLKLLLSRGGDINTINRLGESPLHIVCDQNPELIELFLSLGANPNIKTKGDNKTPLHYVCQNKNHLKYITTLLLAGADPKIEDSHGKDVLSYCMFWKDANKLISDLFKGKIWNKNRANLFPDYFINKIKTVLLCIKIKVKKSIPKPIFNKIISSIFTT